MIKKGGSLGVIILFCVIGLSGCVGTPTSEQFHGTYAANDQTILRVINLNGNVVITAGEENNITLDAVKTSSYGKEELDKISINVTRDGNYLEVQTIYSGVLSMKGSVDYTIKVPQMVVLDSVISTNGAIQITGGKGDVITSSSNGAIILSNIDGYVSAQTSNAHVQVTNTTGIQGGIHTSNGAITADVSDFHGTMSIETSNAGITVYLNPSLNAIIDMSTSNGKITVEGVSLNVSVFEETHVFGSLGSNGSRLDIHTSNANIHLRGLPLF
jgi:hypothetical protein